MIADVTFINASQYRPSDGRYPVFGCSSGLSPPGEVTINDCKVTGDLDQIITVPEFNGYREYNMVKIGDTYYGISSSTHATLKSNMVSFTIHAVGVTTALSNNKTIGGWLVRAPFREDKMGEINGAGLEEEWTVTEIPKLPVVTNDQIYWVEFSTTKRLIENDHAVQGGVHRYGFFSYYDPVNNTGLPTQNGTMPTIIDLMNMSSAGIELASADIIDVSVSVRCPYKYARPEGGTPRWELLHGTTRYTPRFRFATNVFVYNLIDLDSQGDRPTEEGVTDHEIDLGVINNDSFPKRRLTLRNENGVNILDIDKGLITDHSVLTSHKAINISMRVYSDLSGIYTELKIGGTYITVPEGKIPWSGTAWDQYRAYNMNYDRESMNEDIRYNRQQRITGTLESATSGVAMGLISGNPLIGAVGGIASAAGGAITSGIDARMKEEHSMNQQKLKEEYMRVQPGTIFNPGYGLSYIFNNNIRNLSIVQFNAPYYADDPTYIGHPQSRSYGISRSMIPTYQGFWRMKHATAGLSDKLLEERVTQEMVEGAVLYGYKVLL